MLRLQGLSESSYFDARRLAQLGKARWRHDRGSRTRFQPGVLPAGPVALLLGIFRPALATIRLVPDPVFWEDFEDSPRARRVALRLVGTPEALPRAARVSTRASALASSSALSVNRSIV